MYAESPGLIDEERFFREATLRLCGGPEIGKALWNCFMFIREVIPADFLVLSIVDPSLKSIEVVAISELAGGRATSVISPIPPVIEQAYGEALRDQSPNQAFVVNPGDAATTWNTRLLNQGSALMVLPTRLEDGILRFAHIGNNQGRPYSREHVRLFSLLYVPFDIAISNYLRQREVLRLKDVVEDNSRYFQDELRQHVGDEIIGANFGLKQIMDMVRQVAPLASPVLLLGETGTGKELIASAIHNSSPRKDGPFIKLNCGAVPETLVDSELFGHEKGAFTGALALKRGRFERAHRGTLFLDEIGELPLDVQVRLLRALQEKEIERVGGTSPVHVDIRVIAATHRNLEAMLAEGALREDLYFRLNVFPIIIPPLRERGGTSRRWCTISC